MKRCFEHICDYKSFYDRVKLDIGENENALLPTDERLYKFRDEPDDLALHAFIPVRKISFNFIIKTGNTSYKPSRHLE